MPESGNENETGFGGLRSPVSSATRRTLSGMHPGDAVVCIVSVKVSWLPWSAAAVIEIRDCPSGQESGGVVNEVPSDSGAEEFVVDAELEALPSGEMMVEEIEDVGATRTRVDVLRVFELLLFDEAVIEYEPVGEPKTAK